MKKLLLIMLTALLAPVALSGQSKEINDIFDKYEKKRSVESVVISPGMFAMANHSVKDKEAQEWISKISEMRILSVGSNVMENNVPVRQSLKADMEKLIATFNFTRALKAKDSEDEVELYVNKNKSGALLFLNSSTEEYTVIAMFGNIDDKLLKTAMSGGINIK